MENSDGSRETQNGKEYGTLKERKSERPLWLSEEEAMGLLDIVLVAPEELTQEQRAAVAKLSEFCRQFLRNTDETSAGGHPVVTPVATPAVFVA